MSQHPSIYYVDLTYDTSIVSIASFPIALGYIAGYIEKMHPRTFNKSLFKFSHDLKNALYKSPPDILACSLWPWNTNITLAALQQYRRLRPDGLVVVGGANFPMDDTVRQEDFLQTHKELIDICVHHDGELGMDAVLSAYLSCGRSKEKMRQSPISGCSMLHSETHSILVGEYIPRPICLDDIPSPYLSGLMDTFFDDMRLSPMVQHTRGCPFSCGYCQAGNRRNSNIRQFSVDRVLAELDYICSRRKHTENTTLSFSDSNFGIYPSDELIAEKIASMQKEFSFPTSFETTYGSAHPARVRRVATQIQNFDAGISLQSTNENILNTIKRKNLPLPDCKALVNDLHAKGITVYSEIITALPGETRETHLQTLRDVVETNFDEVSTHSLMLLEGSELCSAAHRKLHAWDTRFRILPRNYGMYDGKIVFEEEEIVVASNTFTLDDFLYTRILHCVIRIIFNNAVYIEYIEYLRQNSLDTFEFLMYFNDAMKNDKEYIGEFYKSIHQEALSELWNTKQALTEHFMQQKNYDALVAGDEGGNLLANIKTLAITELFPVITKFYSRTLQNFILEKTQNTSLVPPVHDICAHIFAKAGDILVFDDASLRKTVVLNYDVPRWAHDGYVRPLQHYAHNQLELTYVFSASGQKIRDENCKFFKNRDSKTWKGVAQRILLASIFRAPA